MNKVFYFLKRIKIMSMYFLVFNNEGEQDDKGCL